MSFTHLIFYAFLLFSNLMRSKSEEAFCDNKCSGEGVITSRSCYCDKACSVYNDCCVDSKYRLENSTTQKSLVCKRKALSINSCSKEWNGPDFILKSCKSSSNVDVDPVGNAPITSLITGVTYSSYYCAICNGDAENVVMWNIQMSCPQIDQNLASLSKDEVFNYIFYNHPTHEWGYVLRDDKSKKMSFHGCALTSEIPQEHQNMVRWCETTPVQATCAPTWKNDIIRKMCEEDSYTDPVFSNRTQYKNFYCAVCNHIDQSKLTCGNAMGPRTSNQPESDDNNKLSFSLLLDINFSDGNVVGKRLAVLNCLKGEIFDPFARRCRNIVCGVPGFILRDGLCVPDEAPPI